MSVLNSGPYTNYSLVKKDNNLDAYLNNSGVRMYNNGVTHIEGDIVLVNGVLRGNFGPLLNETGATVNTVLAGAPLISNKIDSDFILNSGTGNGQSTQNTVTFQNPVGPVSQNVIVTGNLTVNGITTMGAPTITGDEIINGNIKLNTIGNMIFIKSGSGASIGTATLVAGTVTVANTNIATGDIINITRSTAGGVIGQLKYTINNGVGFTISSVDTTNVVIADTSIVNYVIFRPY